MPNAHWTVNIDSIGNAIFINNDPNNKNFRWDFGTGDISIAKNPTYKFKINGSINVKLVVTNSYGCTDEFDSTILLNIHNSGIKENIGPLESLSIYPNPFQTSITLEYSLTKSTNVKIQLFDITGNQISVITNEIQSNGKHEVEINSKSFNLSPGIYLLKITLDDGYVSRHIVKM
jgi:PKD repeat protein